MTPWNAKQLATTLGISLLIWVVLAGACLMVGSTGTIGVTREQLGGRLEMVLLASLVGAALAGAGVVYQAILQNPLADPYLLGVSSGASLAAYLWRFLPLGAVAGLAGLSQQAFAFTGAMIAVAVVFTLAGARGRLEPLTLLLVGVIVNAVNGSIYLLINTINRGLAASGSVESFLVGGLQVNLTTDQQLCATVAVAIGWIVLMYFSGELNVAVLSEGEAMSLGVRIHRLRWVAMIVASLVTAAAVAVSGPIGFVGLVCPHLARLIVGQDHRRLLPVAMALGAGLLAVADAISRKLAAQDAVSTQLPVGVLTGLLGGPFFLLLLWQMRRRVAA